MDFSILDGQDIVYHLVSSNVPTTSNQHISLDIQANVLFSSYLFDACVEHSVKKLFLFPLEELYMVKRQHVLYQRKPRQIPYHLMVFKR